MRLRALPVLVVGMVLAASPVLAQKVYIDYDKEYNFDNIGTFAWFKSEETSLANSDPLLHSRIVNAIEHHLTAGGIRELDSGEDPDIYVTYHSSSKEEMRLNTTSFGYGYPGAWGGYGRYGGYYGGGIGSSTTSVSTYEVGTLIVDAWDSKTKKLVWRGTATNMTVSQNPDKMQKRIEKALQKIVNRWQKIKAEG